MELTQTNEFRLGGMLNPFANISARGQEIDHTMVTNSNTLSSLARVVHLQPGVDTVSRGATSTTSGWSKEAIFTLLGVLLTAVLAVVGFALRCYMNTGTLGRRSKRGKRVEAGKQLDEA